MDEMLLIFSVVCVVAFVSLVVMVVNQISVTGMAITHWYPPGGELSVNKADTRFHNTMSPYQSAKTEPGPCDFLAQTTQECDAVRKPCRSTYQMLLKCLIQNDLATECETSCYTSGGMGKFQSSFLTEDRGYNHGCFMACLGKDIVDEEEFTS